MNSSLKQVEQKGSLKNMYDFVHRNKKWFYFTKIHQAYHLTTNEEPPEWNVKSKRYVTKIILMASVGQPHFNPHYNPHYKQYFHVKLGI